MWIRLTALIVMFLTAVLGTTLQAQEPLTIDVFTEGGGVLNFTPDGRYMVAARYELPAVRDIDTRSDNFIDVYRVSDFSLVASYEILDDGPEFVAISHDTRLIAYVKVGGLYVLDTTTGETTQHTNNFFEFEGLEFNPVNNLLAYLIGRRVTVFDPTNPSVHYDLLDNVYGGTIPNIAWSPDGRYLAHGVFRGGETGHDVVVWDVTDLESPIDEEPSFALLGGEPVHVAWRDSDMLASFGSGGVSIFDIPSRSLIVFIPNPGSLSWSRGTWSPDGSQLIAAGGYRVPGQPNPVIQIWNVSNLPAYESIFYQEGVIGNAIRWTTSGLFYRSRGGLRREGEFLAPQLTATALGTPVMPSALTPTTTPFGFVASAVPTRTSIPPTFTPSPTDRIMFDDNFALNGGFEQDLTPDVPLYWFSTGLTSDDRRECNDLPAAGECLFRFSSSSPSSTQRTLFQRNYISTELVAGDRLTLSGQFSGDNFVGGGSAYLRIFYSDGSVSSIFLPIPPGTFDYITLTNELIVGNNPVSQIEISIELPGESTGVLRVDNMRLIHTFVTPEAPLPRQTPSRTSTANQTPAP